MLSQQEIQQALRASRVVPLGVTNPHGPLGLEQLAAEVNQLTRTDREELVIPLRRETREKLEQLAQAEGQTAAGPITAADLAAAVVERFVASLPDS
jgi:hypothetical protein